MSGQQNEQTELLKEMVKWLRFSGMRQVKDVLTSTLDNEKKILAYHHSDGKNTSTVISKLSGISHQAISDLWKEWISLELGDAVTASGGSRFRKSFDLKMFGIQVPQIKSQTNEEKPAEIKQDHVEEEHNEQR